MRKGFTILEVIIAMGLMSLMAYYLAELMHLNQRSIKDVENKAEIVQYLQEVRYVLQDFSKCTAVFAGKTLPTTVTEIPEVVTKTYSVRLVKAHISLPNTIPNGESGTVVVGFTFHSDALQKDYYRANNLTVTIGNDGKIEQCHNIEKAVLDSAVELACEALGGDYLEGKCDIQEVVKPTQEKPEYKCPVKRLALVSSCRGQITYKRQCFIRRWFFSRKEYIDCAKI
jgi:prepilin-type N-terminal cleavage/methylation domain-containing protein